MDGAARERLQPERAGAGEGVQHPRVLHHAATGPGRVPEHVEQRLPHAVGSGARRGGAGGGEQPASAVPAGDDPQKRAFGSPALSGGIGVGRPRRVPRRADLAGRGAGARPSCSRSTFGFTSSTAPGGSAPSWNGP